MSESIEIVSWNVNGLRAVLNKGFADFIKQRNADIVCVQEIKAREEQIPKLEVAYDKQFYHSAERPGYSGTAALLNREPLNVTTNFPPSERHPGEGRIMTLEFDAFYLVNVYVPNAQDGLRRLDYRCGVFDVDFRTYLCELDKTKPVIACGDFNVAHEEIDLARPKQNRGSAGFSDEERAEFTKLLKSGFVDVFRHFHPGEGDHYTWWSYRGGARGRNVGWRIDYFLVSERFLPNVENVEILSKVLGSDHCPISMTVRV
ncbi:MAG: exodeoxyribonuclease III [Puniceicoccales bacterium]